MGAMMTWERIGARKPFLHKSLFDCLGSFAAYFGAMVLGFLLYGQLYYIPF